MLEGGVWRTVGGRRIFIKDGEDLKTAMKKSGKFNFNKKNDDKLKENVLEETKKVEETANNELKPFKKEEINEQIIRDRAGDISKEDIKECLKITDEVYKNAEMHEPKISEDLIENANATNSKMYGLDFRMKQPNSLAGKIVSDAKTDGISYKQAGANIKDAVRYTMILDENNFVNKYSQIKSNLEAKGYKEVRLKNFYKMYEEGTQCQKAIQCVYSTKDGYKFELQYHTSNSQGAKELNHPLYEEYRKSGTSPARRQELYDKMRKIGTHVNNPKDILKL